MRRKNVLILLSRLFISEYANQVRGGQTVKLLQACYPCLSDSINWDLLCFSDGRFVALIDEVFVSVHHLLGFHKGCRQISIVLVKDRHVVIVNSSPFTIGIVMQILD